MTKQRTIINLFSKVIIIITFSTNNAQQTTYDTLSIVPDMSGGINYYHQYNTLVPSAGAGAFGAGDYWGWTSMQDHTLRSYLTFDISTWLNIEESIISIKLLIYLWRSSGNDITGPLPIWDVDGGDTLNLVLDHIDIGNFVDVGDWSAGDPGDTQTIESNAAIVTTSPRIGWKGPVVTDQILYDLENQNQYSQFRLGYHIITDNDGLDDAVWFRGHNFDFDVYLIAEYISLGIVQNDEDANNIITISPNPFNSNTIIKISNNQLNIQGIEIYNLRGRSVLSYKIGNQRNFIIKWNGKSENGEELPSGLYLLNVLMEDRKLTRKITYLK